MPLIRPRVEGSDKADADERIPVAKKKAAGDEVTLKAVLGWIPIEVIGAFKAGIGCVPLSYPAWRLGISLAGIPLTFLWIAYATRPEGKAIAWRQAIISPLAFAFWVAAIEPDVMTMLYGDWQTWMGSLVLAAGMLALPIFDGILRSLGVKQKP